MGTWVRVIVSCDVTGFAKRPQRSLWSLFTTFLNFKNMPESDFNSASSSSEDQQQNEESGIDEFEVRIDSTLPYQDEPVAQVAARTDEDEMDSDNEGHEGHFSGNFGGQICESCFC